MNRLAVILFFSTTTVAACGLSGTDQLFGDTSNGGGGQSSTGTQGTSSGSHGSTTGTATTGSGNPATSSVSSSSGSAATSSSSSSSGSTAVTVFCNGGPCNPGQICCLNPFGSNPPDHCGTAGQCGMGFVELTCNGPEDCPGQVCCVSFQQMPGQPPIYTGSVCTSSCTQANQRVVCSDANPNCPAGFTCQDSQLLGDGYKICAH